jgi:phosphonate transport system permease protein
MSGRVDELRRSREKNWFLRVSAILVLLGILWAWLTSQPLLGRLSAERRWLNFQNFAGELIPSPVRKSGQWSEAVPWAGELLHEGGLAALWTTLGIATAAIILSAVCVIPLLTLASRELSRPNPFGLWSGRMKWIESVFRSGIGAATRFAFVLARAVPEYIVAFLLISLLGLQVWPLVLALAIHNFGILGRLWGEVAENSETAPPIHGLGCGQSRSVVFISRLFPADFNRLLIYFFYRWETCVKDATVLGMLGLLTLGKLIALSKGFFWDKMFFYILLGSSVILLGDLFSTFLRRKLR